MLHAAQHKRDVGGRLRVAIDALGLTYSKVARDFALGHPSKLGNWMRGTDYPNQFFLYQFCSRYPVTTDWILLGEPRGVPGALGDTLWAAWQASSVAPAAALRPAREPAQATRERPQDAAAKHE